MRSRYAAYALGDANYIIATTDPAGPMWEPDETTWRANIADFTSCTFRGVDILEHDTDGDRGSVRFRARLERDGEDLTFEEHSDFVRTGGRWLYHGPRGHVAG